MINLCFVYKIFFPKYLESTIYSQVLILTLLFFPKTLIDSVITVNFQKKKLYFFKITSFIVNILLLIILIPELKIWGIVIARIGTQIYKTIVLFGMFNRI